MNRKTDFRQHAALKCLAAGKLDPDNPYSGPYYRRAYQSVERDAFRRQTSTDRRIATFFDSSGTSERYNADVRYERGGVDSDDPLKCAAAREESQLLIRALELGVPGEAELVAAHDLRGKATSELARERGTTESAIRARICRERYRVKKELEARGIAE